jgi:3-oxoacyl-[acyl-carrier-protein] synthase III
VPARIAAIEYHLPEKTLTSADLSAEFPEWPVEKIQQKVGISTRHVAAENECASDLGEVAARKLFASGAARPEEIDFLLFCTQSPDYFLPTTACLLQDRLGLPISAGALDFNLGCSGFVYGLSLAHGLIATGAAKKILFITAETYTKFLHPGDKSVRTIFGDAGAATLVEALPDGDPDGIGPFLFGTDGSGGQHLIVPTGGMRERRTEASAVTQADNSGNLRSRDSLYMNGAEVFTFTISRVPDMVRALLAKTGLQQNDVDLFVFHQANRYMMETLRKNLKIDSDRFFVYLEHCANTVSATIPIALKAAAEQGRLKPGMRVMLVGFGVGLSWAATMVRW